MSITHTTRARMRRWLAAGGLMLVLLLAWLATSNSQYIWPLRNTLQYRLLTWWQEGVGPPDTRGKGSLTGTVFDATGQPLAGATVLLAERDGTTHSAYSDKRGRYRILDIPAGSYVVMAGAPGFASTALRWWGLPLGVEANAEQRHDIRLDPRQQPVLEPGRDLQIGEPQQLTCSAPVPASALRRSISFQSGSQPNQPTFLYTPITTSVTAALPTVLAIYPGPAADWECASVPLAEAGFAVLAAGPAYSLDLEADIDELQRLLSFVQEGAIDGADGERIAVVAGSYSGLHALRLLDRGLRPHAALLLGPPTDLFDMRRRLEDRTFIPPYGLDQVLIALGLPDRAPERFWRYSGAYHVAPDWPPLALLHSRDDDVVPLEQSELLAARLRHAGVAHETLFFDGAQHYLLGDPGQIALVYDFTIAFLQDSLLHAREGAREHPLWHPNPTARPLVS